MKSSRNAVSVWFPLVGLTLLCGVVLEWPPGYVPYDKNRVEQVFLLCALAIGVFFSPQILIVSWKSLAPWARSLLGLVSLLGAASAMSAQFPRLALLEWGTVVLLICASLVLSGKFSDASAASERARYFLLATAGTVVAIKVLVGYLAALTQGVRLDTLLLFEGMFSNRRFFGHVATLLVPLLTLAYLQTGNMLKRVLWFTLLSTWWMLVIVSGTRGTWLALLVAHVAVIVWTGRASGPWLEVQARAAGMGLLGFLILFQFVPWIFGLDAGVESRMGSLTTLSQREVIWGLARDHALQHPLLGIGPMHFAAFPNPVAAHPHNAFLQLAAEWGLPSAAMGLAIAVGGLLALIRPLRAQYEQARMALSVSLLGISIQSLVDGVIVVPYTQTWLLFVVGWGLSLHQIGTRPVAVDKNGAGTVRLLAAGVLGLMLYGVMPEILNRSEAIAVYLESHDGLVPRYWSVGWIP